jgi:hypothetical protein
MRKAKIEDRTANGNGRTDRMVQANLEAFASIGLVQNDFISGICRMDYVTPGYILGQKRRLEAERRYSGGLLLKVVQCGDELAEEYVVGEDSDPPQPPLKGGEKNPPERRRSPSPHPLLRGEQRREQFLGNVLELEEEDGGFEIEPDASIHEPLSPEGMTAARAWPAVLRELQSDMPRATYERWVRDTVLLSARDGIFVVGAQSGYTRDWLESRLTSKIARLLAGICNTSMQIRFMELAAWGQ